MLAAQAVLVAAAALPLYWYSGSRAIVCAYLLFGGVQEALWFDFHEVALAPLPVALAVWLEDRGRTRESVACVLFLLLVKEDLTFLVSAFGVWYLLRGHRRLGPALIAAGLLAYLAITGPLMPGEYTYAGQYPGPVLDGLPQKLETLAYLLGAFLALPLLSPLLVLALPLLAARFLGDNPKHWTLEDHYSLTIAPVLALAAADGLRRFPKTAPALVAVAVLCVPLFLTIPGATPRAYRAAEEALAVIPPAAPVTASNRLVPHLSARDEIRLPDRPPNRYVAIALEDASPEGLFPFESVRERDAWLRELRGERVFHRDGMLVLLLQP